VLPAVLLLHGDHQALRCWSNRTGHVRERISTAVSPRNQ
jgi:hypothetical protein